MLVAKMFGKLTETKLELGEMFINFAHFYFLPLSENAIYLTGKVEQFIFPQISQPLLLIETLGVYVWNDEILKQ